ncbi:hypothetical protein ElyMa_002898300 [Elysia marginata]|uniref:Uncharacterized protein n=1 Tax=Elysia marginata TaxID=1093978 RepID=A0AAV4I316_9GAST|nr:hypothetical protein ElyMa_002898300 [Elysia marginata]
MLHSGLIRGAGGAKSSNTAVMSGGVPSAKPYAVMEFEGLLATALSNQSLETLRDFPGGVQHDQQLHRSTPPALPLAPPAEALAHWKRVRAMGRVPTEIRTSPHHIPKSSSDGGLMRRAYLDVTHPQFCKEVSPEPQVSQHHKLLQDRLHQSSQLRQDIAGTRTHGGFFNAKIRSPTSSNLRTSSPWSSVAVSRLVSPRSLQNVPPSNLQPDILPRHHRTIPDNFLSEHHHDLSPRIHGQSAPEVPLTESGRVCENTGTRVGHPDVLHVANISNANNSNVMSYTPTDNPSNSAFPKSFRATADNPSSSTLSLSINTTGSSSSPGSLFSSPPSHHNFTATSNSNTGNLAPVSYFAHSPFADSASGNTSATLSDGPIPIVNLLQVSNAVMKIYVSRIGCLRLYLSGSQTVNTAV